jgi:HAD superfamily hydrolase (TIGR01450 family)
MSIDFSPYEAVLMDLDGTLYKEDHPLPGAMALLRQLKAAGRVVAFPSNSTQSPQRVAHRLREMGADVHDEVIFTAAREAVEHCLERFGTRPRIFNLATEGVAELLAGKAIDVQGEAEPCDAVIIGNPACVHATPQRTTTALRLLRNGAACVGICDDRVYPSAHGMEIGSGAMARMLAYAADVPVIFFGKPQRRFFEKLCAALSVRPERCLMIGDNLDSDISGAKAMGMRTILCLGGVTRESELASVTPEREPDWVVKSLEELLSSTQWNA